MDGLSSDSERIRQLELRIAQLETELEDMTASLAQAWDQLVPFLNASPEPTGTAVNVMPLLESIMAAVDAPMGAVYLSQRSDQAEEWRTLPSEAFSLRTLQHHLHDHDPHELLRLTGPHPWSGSTSHWLFVPLVVDGEVAGAIGVGFDSGQREFSNLDTKLLRRMSERAANQIIAASLAESREREAQIAHELQIAGMIQRSIQPVAVPTLAGIRVASDWKPAATVGGDAWGWTLQPSGKLACYVLDVAGKGLPASLGAVSLRAATQTVLRLGFNPVKAMHAVNEEFYAAYTDAGIMATLNIFTIDPASGEFCQANAGHNPTLIRHGGEWLRFPASAPPIGVVPDINPRLETITLNSGDMLVCYSDGLSEIDTADGLWGEAGILNALRQISPDPQSTLQQLLTAADTVRRGRAPSDDQTLVCAVFDGLTSEIAGEYRRRLVIPAELHALEALETFIAEWLHSLPESSRMELLLVLHELCMNIVEHGYAGNAGYITIDAARDAHEVTFRVTDQAPNSYTPPVAIAAPDPDSLPEGGWGISIMHSVMDHVHYERADHENRWLMVKRLSAYGGDIGGE